MRTNKKGMDGRYRYRICIGKDEHGMACQSIKTFMLPPPAKPPGSRQSHNF